MRRRYELDTKAMERLGWWHHVELKGRVTVKVWDADIVPTYVEANAHVKLGIVPIETQVVDNLVVTVGHYEIADWIVGEGYVDGFQYCGIGSGTTAAAVGDTDIETAIGSRKIATSRSRTNKIATISTFFASGDNNGTWTESVLAEASSGGRIFSRALFDAAITKDTTKTITVDWDITVG